MRTLWIIFCWAGCSMSLFAQPSTFFPVEQLAPEQRKKAETLLWKMLDSEALYTVVGGTKPISDGFWQFRYPADQPPPPSLLATKEILATFRSDEIECGLLIYDKVFNQQRFVSAWVAHKSSLRALIQHHPIVFTALKVTPQSSPQQVLEAIDRAEDSLRWRGFGLVFGYPEYAVNFFVKAGEEQKRTGQFVERDFIHLPTGASDQGRFVYAVPKGHVANTEDQRLKEQITPIFTEYTRRKEWYIGEGKAGPVYLLRDWLSPPLFMSQPVVVPEILDRTLIVSTCNHPPTHQPRFLCRLRRFR